MVSFPPVSPPRPYTLPSPHPYAPQNPLSLPNCPDWFLGPTNLLSNGHRLFFAQIMKLAPHHYIISQLPLLAAVFHWTICLRSWYSAIFLKPSGYFMYQCVLMFTNFTFCPQSVFISVRVAGFSLQHGHHSNPAAPNLYHRTSREQKDRCGNSTAQSQAPDDGYINVRRHVECIRSEIK